MRGSDFILIVLIYCVINKKKNRVGSYIDYPDAIKKYAATVALNH